MTDSANTKHIGDLIVTKGNAANVAHITEVTGNLHILAEGAALPVLTSVGGNLHILAEGAALPVLTSVGGDLYIKAQGVALPVLTSVGGDLYIKAQGVALPVLTSVGGHLSIKAQGAALPVLTSVGGDLYIKAQGAALPVLTSVGCALSIAIGIHFDHSHIAFGAGQVLAVWKYALHVKDGQYRAGCRGPWSAEEALAHWHAGHPEPSRAEAFREAIAAQEAAKKPA